ncbi:putative DNA mismatch repair protein MSH7 [Capsicum annuum]|nr:putative DNA mismatch repair protein MSH7 [Capsicum annuum]
MRYSITITLEARLNSRTLKQQIMLHSHDLDQGLSSNKFCPMESGYPPLLLLIVKQISQAVQSSDEKSNFVIDGVDVNNVAYKKSERVTDVPFTIDDGTGRTECIRWVNDAVDSKEVKYSKSHLFQPLGANDVFSL